MAAWVVTGGSFHTATSVVPNFLELRTRAVNRIEERSDEQFHVSSSTRNVPSSTAPLIDFPESSYGGVGHHKELASLKFLYQVLVPTLIELLIVQLARDTERGLHVSYTTTSTIPLAPSIKPRTCLEVDVLSPFVPLVMNIKNTKQ
jgi:hypothetical protein